VIVVFGSLNMDLVMPVAVLPRPGETVLCPGYQLKPGGKGANQAVAAARAGARTALFGCVGRDDFGSALIDILGREGIDVGGIQRTAEPTGCAMICVDAGGENFIAVASGANRTAAAALVPDTALGAGTTVLMQMEVPAPENWGVLTRARRRGARTVLNVAPAAPVPTAALADLDVLVVNELEAATIAGTLDINGVDGPDLARALAKAADVTCIITLGAAGAVAAERDGALWQVDTLRVEAVDTTGAGDAFCGILTAALDAGLALPEALRRASVGAALACTALGAQESLPAGRDIAARLAEVATPRRLS
jgi:ribokinase